MKQLLRVIFTFSLLFSAIRTYCQQTASTAQFRREFLENINHTRSKGCTCGMIYMPPVPPLSWNKQLEIAAMGHAQDMAVKNYFNHTSLDGRTMGDRIASAGYTFKGFKSFTIGENIAQGQESIAEVMQGWFKSPGHCRNLMNSGFKEVGVAVFNDYWVQDFGGREAFSPEVQRLLKSGKYHLVQKE